VVSVKYRRLAAHLVLAVLISSSAWAQGRIGSPPAAPAAAPAQPERPKDPLGRDTPRGTVLGFMTAARGNQDDIATQYLNSGLRGEPAAALAHQLYVVLNSRLPVRVNILSDQIEGSLVNPLRPDQDVVGTINTSNGPLELVVERVDVGGGARAWLFSRATLSAIPRVYQEINLVTVDRYLPSFLTQPHFAGVRLFDWLVFLVGLPLLYRLLGFLGWVFGPLLALCGRYLKLPDGDTPRYVNVHGSVRLLLIAALIRIFILNVDTPLAERQYWAVIRAGLVIVGGVWLVLLLNRFAERKIQERIGIAHFGESVALLRLARRVGDVLVVSVGLLLALAYFGVDPTAALAGLGIGGIAVALAAQKTLENVIGGFSLVFDGALRVGDVLKLGDMVGTVDQIGLRSTRIRTMDRTVVSVPNGQISTLNIETLSERDKFWFRHVVGLRYETTPEQIRSIVKEMRELLARQPEADLDSVRVRFLRLGAFSLDVELFTYFFAKDWNRFLEIQEGLLLQIMEIVERAGTQIAFPSQTLHLADDRVQRMAPSDADLPTVAT
jgi:MscS family membrane protein